LSCCGTSIVPDDCRTHALPPIEIHVSIADKPLLKRYRRAASAEIAHSGACDKST
jgi:hypothetical protein